MGLIQDSDYILYKALSNNIIGGLKEPLESLTAKSLVELGLYEKQKAKFLSSETYDNIGENSKKLQESRAKLISILAVQDRMDKIVKRNNARLEFFKTKLDAMGIYNDKVDKKTISAALSAEAKNVSETSLNLNSGKKDGLVYKFFAGEILAFDNSGRLDFSVEYNGEVLKNANSDFVHEIVSAFPYTVATIPEEFYLISTLKNNVLKECILYAASKAKTQKIAQTNQDLGGLLSGANYINNVQEFAKQLKNYFNVCVKQCIKKNAPQLETEADKLLRCNESSEFLPPKRRIAPLAGGIAADEQKDAEKESEEVRIDQEKEAQKEITKQDLLDILLLDDEDELEEQAQEQKDNQLQEEQKELNEQDLLDEKIRELELALKKNDTVEG